MTAESAPAARSGDARVLTVALAVGLLAGLGEGAGLLLDQATGNSSWSIHLWSGPEVLWVAPLLDAALAFVFACLAVAFARLLGRPAPLAAVFALGVAALAYDWSRITHEMPRRYALLVALLGGTLAFLLARRNRAGVARFGNVAAPLLAIATLVVAAVVEGGARIAEARAEANLPEPPRNARDVILVLLDTVRPDHLSAYGYPRRTSPVLERIAAEGVRFDACFSTSSWTLPAHASVLTGRLPWEHGAALEPLDTTWPMLSEELASHGLRSGAFSGNLCFFQRGFGFARGFSRFDDFGWSWKARLGGTLLFREFIDRAGKPARERLLRKPARAVTDAFLRWLDRAPERPVFAFLNWYDAHTPYHPPGDLAGDFDGIPSPPPARPQDPSQRGPWRDAEIARDQQRYDECLLGLDRELGRLIDELSRRGRFERTLLIVLSDHGEAFGEHGTRYHRGSLHREQVEVPLVIRAPGLVPAGAVATGVASIASLPATVMELLGLPSPFPGPSLAPLWSSAEVDGGGVAVLELARHPWAEYRIRPCNDGALRSIVRGRWRYIWHETRGEQLFDRANDPEELHDVKDAHPEVAAALARELESELAARSRHPREPSGLDLSARPNVAGVGYIDDH